MVCMICQSDGGRWTREMAARDTCCNLGTQVASCTDPEMGALGRREEPRLVQLFKSRMGGGKTPSDVQGTNIRQSLHAALRAQTLQLGTLTKGQTRRIACIQRPSARTWQDVDPLHRERVPAPWPDDRLDCTLKPAPPLEGSGRQNVYNASDCPAPYCWASLRLLVWPPVRLRRGPFPPVAQRCGLPLLAFLTD